ncbi:DUF3265 domain-containing protein, partial [Vibrio vulnificus]|nr:DUF3265 domain-containing protein [Vibrio vulnificus]
GIAKLNPLSLKHNKAFKRDSCRVAFVVCSEFCGESGLRKVGLGGIHPLTQRYGFFQKLYWLDEQCLLFVFYSLCKVLFLL